MDEHATEAEIRSCLPCIYRMAQRMAGTSWYLRADMQSAVNEAVAYLAPKWKRSGGMSLRGFLLFTVRSRLKNERKKQRKRGLADVAGDMSVNVRPLKDSDLWDARWQIDTPEYSDEMPWVLKAISQAGESRADIMRKVILEGKSFPQVAKERGISKERVRQLYLEGKEKVYEYLCNQNTGRQLPRRR